MIRLPFQKSADAISRFLQNPVKVLIFCLVALGVSLILDGSLLHLWQLDRDSKDLSQRIINLKAETVGLEQKIKRARDPSFIEVQAREKFELASEGELVFVFADEN